MPSRRGDGGRRTRAFRRVAEVLQDAGGERRHLYELMDATGLTTGVAAKALGDLVADGVIEHDSIGRTWWWRNEPRQEG